MKKLLQENTICLNTDIFIAETQVDESDSFCFSGSVLDGNGYTVSNIPDILFETITEDSITLKFCSSLKQNPICTRNNGEIKDVVVKADINTLENYNIISGLDVRRILSSLGVLTI